MKVNEIYIFYFLTFLNEIHHVTDNCRVQVLGKKIFFFPAMADGQTADDYNKKIKKMILENQKDFSMWLQTKVNNEKDSLRKLQHEISLQQLEIHRTQLQIEQNCRALEYQQYVHWNSPYFDNVDYVGTNQILCEQQGISANIIAEKTALFNQHIATKTTLEQLLELVATQKISISCICKYERSLKIYICYINIK